MTNPLKGQIEVKLGSVTYTARLTVDSIIKIETAVGCGIIKLAQKMGDADIRITDLITVLHNALRGGGNDLQEKDINKIIQDVGIIEATRCVAELITQSLIADSDEGADEGKPVLE
tara:strand:+ start:619 stop:966 length:348 start_codon:yes stop_codon:yes gene_type:complete